MTQQMQLKAIIRGYVQGVSFRYFTHRAAHRVGVTGWVANQADGSVIVVAEGDQTSLQELLAFLQEGSPAARVEQVEAFWAEATGAFHNFSVRYLYG